uniref:ATP synthase subunit a n=1 Tax=Steganacarus magnus TaxID=52000 RepID=B6Z5U7_9ACAR|nr:ATP synthase F0 subunit 6 [Steganacarus magnus]ACH41148.1 ATP synthase F0 subunit 6 [Steganacarus magnus]
MVNLFSIFDPSFSVNSFSLIVIFLPLLYFFFMEYNINLLNFMREIFVIFLINECSQVLKSKYNIYSYHFSLFFIFLIFNLLSLSPFIFPLNSHISLVFPIGLMFWLVPILSIILKIPYFMVGSFLPQGTPIFLMPFMVLIEMISLIIRPITLSVRLTANITAGHLLISILLNFLLSFSFNLLSLIPIMMMMVLEFGVAIIQSYVFFTLLNMYISEI